LACLSLLPSTAHAQPVKLRITLQLPITNHLGVNLKQFKEEVESKTGGAIVAEIFDRARLYKDNEALAAVSSGAVEMGTVGLSQFRKKSAGPGGVRPAVPVQFRGAGPGGNQPGWRNEARA
jgi:TRAP-type C4-dicarboxylate transport system substrate-binding protein